MKIKITEEQVFEIARRYGLSAEKTDQPGFYFGGEKIEAEDLFEKLFVDYELEEVVPLQDNVVENIIVQRKENITFKYLNNSFNTEDLGVA